MHNSVDIVQTQFVQANITKKNILDAVAPIQLEIMYSHRHHCSATWWSYSINA